MKAIGVFTFGGPDALQIVDLPEPEPGPGEVRIRVHAAAVNPTDTTFRAGLRAAQLAYRLPPYVPGMDAAGVVDKLGAGAQDRFAVGDRVIALVAPMGPHGGTYAEQVVVPAASVVAAPVGATFAEASTLLLNAVTARLALDALALKPGQILAVTGAAGALGGYAIQLARYDGLEVIADAAAPDEALVRSLGADHVVARGNDVATLIRSLAPAGVAGLIDAAHQDARTLPAIADGGGLATVRGWNGPTERQIVLHQISSFGSAEDTPLLESLRQRVEDHILTLRVADVLPASQAANAHRRLEAGGVRGRLVLDFSAPVVED
jgi:NADPH2:quinone reductase